jgi:cell wall-associated protease
VIVNFLKVFIFSIMAIAQAPTQPNDRFFSRQWNLHNNGTQDVNIVVDNSHTITQGGTAGVDIGWLEARDDMNLRAKASVLVAVIDTGVDLKHPDLVGRLSFDGWDFVNNLPLTGDLLGHGTRMAGLIAANANNKIGIAGIAPSTVKILPLKIDPDCTDATPDQCWVDSMYNGKALADYVADAVRYAVAHHADIISLSEVWPGFVNTDNATKAFQEAIKAGVIITASAGNDHKIHTPYPCAFDGVICVGSVSNNGEMSLYSEKGGLVDILAPGDDIISTIPTALKSEQLEETGYDLASGTSESSPQVAAVAAAIKSVYPGISPEEVKGRIFSSAVPLVKNQNSLYGIVNLKKALAQTTQTAFWPSFRSLGTILINEKDLSVQGNLSVQVLSAKVTNGLAQISINGKAAGQIKIVSAANGTISIPWNYKFDSLDDAGDLFFKVSLTDDSNLTKVFKFKTLASRKMKEISANKTYTAPGTQSSEWIMKNPFTHYIPNLKKVDNIFAPMSAPIYFRQSAVDNNGSAVQLFDTSGALPPMTITVPGIQQLREIVAADILGDGRRDLVAIGVDGNNQYLEFYFLNPQGQPLGTVSESVWRVPLDSNSLWKLSAKDENYLGVLTDYTGAASWISLKSRLVPAFFTTGRLPKKDNFNGTTSRAADIDNHLYYLSPLESTSTSMPTQLEVRALDNANFRRPYTEFRLVNVVRPSQGNSFQGHVRILAQLGHDFGSPIKILDVPSFEKPSLLSSDWDPLSANSSLNGVLSSKGSVTGSSYFNIYSGGAHGSIAWSKDDGTFQGRTEFSYSAFLSPIRGLFGAFSLPTGNYFFVESSFDLVGYSLTNGATGPQTMQKISIERDSTLSDSEFNALFRPVTVGTTAHPMPGIYGDYTWIQGDQISVMVWDTNKNKLIRPLRYSLQVPAGCTETNPVYLSDAVESLAFPIICQGATTTSQPSIVFVKP